VLVEFIVQSISNSPSMEIKVVLSERTADSTVPAPSSSIRDTTKDPHDLLEEVRRNAEKIVPPSNVAAGVGDAVDRTDKVITFFGNLKVVGDKLKFVMDAVEMISEVALYIYICHGSRR
jgi:hypothetical protein